MIPIAIVAIVITIFIVVAIFKNPEFGFYFMIAFGFLLAFVDRLVRSRIPLYSIIFMIPFILFLAVILKRDIHSTSLRFGKDPIIFGYIITFVYTLVQAFNPQMDSFLGWISYFRQAVCLGLILFISLYLFKDLKHIRYFFKFILAAILITAMYGCIQQWFGFTPFERRWVYQTPGVMALYSLPGGGIRKFSFLTDPANYGTLMASGGLAFVVLSFGPFSRKKRIILRLCSLLIFLSMSYSGTRTANIMVASGLAIYIMMTLNQKKSRILAGIAVAFYLFIMYSPIYSNVTINRLRSAFNSPQHDASYDVRIINRERIRPYIHQHPFGGGVNTTGQGGLQYNPHHYLAGFPPDSSLFSTTLEIGWVGLLIQLSFLFLVLVSSVHYFYRCTNPEIKAYFAAITIIIFTLGLIGAYAQFTLTSMPQIFIFIPLLACIIKLRKLDQILITT